MILDHAPSTEELAPYIARMKASGLEHVEAMVECDMGDEQMYWEVAIVGDTDGDAYTPQDWSDLGVTPRRLTAGVDMRVDNNPYHRKQSKPCKIVFSRIDLSLRAYRVVLEQPNGDRLDIVLSRKDLAQVMA